MKFPGFIAGTGELAAVNLNAERSINLYPEIVDAGTAENRVWLRKRPGYTTFASALGAGPIRALFYQDGRCFAVSDNRFYELFSDGTKTQWGVVNTDSRPAFIASNGQIGGQLFIVSGGSGYIFTLATNTLSAAIAQPGFPANALSGLFADSYFLALYNGYPKFAFSALADGTLWDGADVAQKSQTSDNLLAMIYDHKELWLIGSEYIEIWVNTGDLNNPWSPQPLLIESGICAQDSVVKGDDSIFWIRCNKNGGHTVVRAQGYSPTRISTHAVEHALNGYSRTDDALAWYYDQEGHGFYVVTFPTAEATWAYDVRTQQWHERGYWNEAMGVFKADLPRCHTYAAMFGSGKHLVGSRVDGTVYEMTPTALDDAGVDLRWLRRAPHVVDEGKRVFVNRFELAMRTGVGTQVAPGTDPEIQLRISRDGGNSWSSIKYAQLGPYQQYSRRVFWTRLGHMRNGVFEVSGADPVFVGFWDAFLDGTTGMH